MPIDAFAGSPAAKLAVLAAALAHEAVHACKGCYTSQDQGQTYVPICDFYANEIEAHTLEYEILGCINSQLTPADDDISARMQTIFSSRLAFQTAAENAGC